MAIVHCADELLKQPAQLIDHTLLKAQACKEDIERLCLQAEQFQFFSVCVPPTWVALSKQHLQNSPVKVCTVVGFPLGSSTSKTKILEAQEALENGADELDMVIHIGAALDNDWNSVEKEIRDINLAKNKRLLKVILETCYLTEDQIRQGCRVSQNAGADFVKTSTGFGSAGAKEEDIKVMRQEVGSSMGVKASGGVRNFDDLERMVRAGANRIGASSGAQILSGHSGEGY